MLQAAPQAPLSALEEFKQRTGAKLRDVRCPKHQQSPRVRFVGSSLREVVIQMSGCCDELINLANRAIAQSSERQL